MTLAHRKQALESLATRKSRELLEDYPIVALALTGSLARDTAWVGSDLDFWGFADDAETDFMDGVEDGIYWEIDIAPAEALDLEIKRDTWLNPPAFRDDEVVSLLEALYGCRIIHDPDGKLSWLKAAIDDRMADPIWLRERATRFLAYAMGVLDALQLAPAVDAILYAREVATNYSISAFWMFHQSLFSVGQRHTLVT